jgi:hypothetical protein
MTTNGCNLDAAGETDGSPFGTITIDCDTCVMQRTRACADCVVTFLCDREADEGLARACLASELRHQRR